VQPTFWIAAAVVIIMVVRRFSPIIAAIFGLALAAALAAWGHLTIAKGAGIAFAGFHLSEPAFFVLVAVWVAIEMYALTTALRQRRLRRQADEEEH